MELTIKLLSGKSAGKEIKIPVNKFLIGRADDCHLRPHSDLISRHHCVLLVEEGLCAVRDFGSRNGTFVNDEQIVGQRELHNGDRIKVGNLDFEVQLTSSVGGKKQPKVKDVKDAARRTISVDGSATRAAKRVSPRPQLRFSASQWQALDRPAAGAAEVQSGTGVGMVQTTRSHRMSLLWGGDDDREDAHSNAVSESKRRPADANRRPLIM